MTEAPHAETPPSDRAARKRSRVRAVLDVDQTIVKLDETADRLNDTLDVFGGLLTEFTAALREFNTSVAGFNETVGGFHEVVEKADELLARADLLLAPVAGAARLNDQLKAAASGAVRAGVRVGRGIAGTTLPDA